MANDPTLGGLLSPAMVRAMKERAKQRRVSIGPTRVWFEDNWMYVVGVIAVTGGLLVLIRRL